MTDGPTASGPNAGLLSGRRGPRKRRREGPGHTTELGPHPVVRDFEAGPFPHQPVQAFPPDLVELLERRTGRRLTPKVVEFLAEYERIRAYLGFQGVVVDERLGLAQRLEDLTSASAQAEGLEPELPARARHLATRQPVQAPALPTGSAGMPDPDDLGD